MPSGGYDGANRNYYFQGVAGCSELAIVIPGRSRKRANYDVQLHIGESMVRRRRSAAPSDAIS